MHPVVMSQLHNGALAASEWMKHRVHCASVLRCLPTLSYEEQYSHLQPIVIPCSSSECASTTQGVFGWSAFYRGCTRRAYGYLSLPLSFSFSGIVPQLNCECMVISLFRRCTWAWSSVIGGDMIVPHLLSISAYPDLTSDARIAVGKPRKASTALF